MPNPHTARLISGGRYRVLPLGTRGESGGQTGITYDISNKHRLGYSEVQLVQCMIDGVNTLVKVSLVNLVKLKEDVSF